MCLINTFDLIWLAFCRPKLWITVLLPFWVSMRIQMLSFKLVHVSENVQCSGSHFSVGGRIHCYTRTGFVEAFWDQCGSVVCIEPIVKILLSTTLFHPRETKQGAQCSKYRNYPLKYHVNKHLNANINWKPPAVPSDQRRTRQYAILHAST